MRSSICFAAPVVCVAVLAGCSSADKAAKAPSEPVKKIAETAPAQYSAKFDTTKGVFVVEVHHEWAPRGADRFYTLVTEKFFDGARFYRVRPKFIVQWGISPDPKLNRLWSQLKLPDDSRKQKNVRGTIAFAMAGPRSRTTQVFINLRDNSALLDKDGFVPFGRVVEGMDVVDHLYSLYGEIQSLGGGGPDSAKYATIGDEYIRRSFTFLDQIKAATIVEHQPK